MSTTTVQLVELQFEDDIYRSKQLETKISDVSAGLKKITIDGNAQPTFKLRRAHFIDNTGAQHELITEQELKNAASLHLFFQEDPDKP